MTKVRTVVWVLFLVLYILTGSSMPVHAAFTWTDQSGAGSRQWFSVASSSDGVKLVAVVNVGDIWTSTDSGATWTDRTGPGAQPWRSVASSSNGVKLVAAGSGFSTGDIWTSTDSGATWTDQTGAGSRQWYAVASSANGSKLVAVDNSPGDICTSTDSGATWTDRTGPGTPGSRNWNTVASSSDGSKLVAGVYGGDLWTSTDSGATWTDRTGPGSQDWAAVASSSDGVKLVAAVASGDIWTSTDSGVTWTDQAGAGSRAWLSVASSSDGTKLVAAVSGLDIWTSTDSGVTWTDQAGAGPRVWQSVASSSDGAKLVAVATGAGGGDIWTGVDATLSIDLASFDAVPTASGIALKWTTGTEIDNAGFNLWRSDTAGGDYSRITASIIPAEGNSFTGASYAYEDFDVVKGQTYNYKLQDVDRSGISAFHGPVSTSAGGLSLVSPQDGLSVSSSTAFEWEGVAIKRARVEFSPSAAFGSKILRFSIANGQVSFTPTKAQWKRITALAGQGTTVAWRVTGLDASGNTLTSAAATLGVR